MTNHNNPTTVQPVTPNPVSAPGLGPVLGKKELEGEGSLLKCHNHKFYTNDPVEFYQHVFAGGHTETGSRPCEMPGCPRIAVFKDKPLRARSYCKECQVTLREDLKAYGV